MLRIGSILVVSSLLVIPSAGAVTIDHQPVGCMVAGRFPTITARLDPVDDVGRARVYFRATGTPHWYFVEMRPEAGAFSGVLPMPKKSLKSIEYYVEAVDRASAPSRTPEHQPQVASAEVDCRKEARVAVVAPTARIVLGAAAGAPPMPAGFATGGIVAAGGTAGTTAAGGAAPGGAAPGEAAAGGTAHGGTAGAAGGAGTAAGGGVSTAVVVAGVVAAGAAVAGVAAASGGGSDGRGGTTTTTLAPAPATTTPGPPATTPPASLTGTWVGLNPDGMVVDADVPSCVQALDLTLNLVQSGSSLTGTARIVVREVRRPDCTVGLSFPGSLSGTVVSNTVTFTCTFAFPETVNYNFTGTFTASRMSGTFVTVTGGAGIWSVNRQ